MEPFKNFFNQPAALKIGYAILKIYPLFPINNFEYDLSQLEPLELKERVTFISQLLLKYLPSEDIEQLFFILTKTLKSDMNPEGLCKFLVWPLTECVSTIGLSHFELSIQTLKAMTMVFTSEFAVRPFFIHHETKTIAQFEKWLTDPNEHVRRWISEGSRPLLPWGKKLPRFVENPQLTWLFLETLKNDPSAYVRKSIANHINDHSKYHPDFILAELEQWRTAAPCDIELHRLIKHATRTLAKKGAETALAFRGVSHTSNIQVISARLLTPEVTLGQSLHAEVIFKNQHHEPATLLVDHLISLLRKNGKHTQKVFKGKQIKLTPFEEKRIQLSLTLKPVTVRTYYTGTQFWSLQINGKSIEKTAFHLQVSSLRL